MSRIGGYTRITNIIGMGGGGNQRLTDEEVVVVATELFNLKFVWEASDGVEVDILAMTTQIAEKLLADRGIDMDVYDKAISDLQRLKVKLRADLLAGVKARNQARNQPKADAPQQPATTTPSKAPPQK